MKAQRNAVNVMDGRDLLRDLPADSVPLVFFDPQYRAVLDKLKFGNEGARQGRRHALQAMPDEVIGGFIREIARSLKPSGHLALWIDKFSLGTGQHLGWLPADLKVVDIISWDTGRFGMGRRSRSRMQFMVIGQKMPIRAKGCWLSHSVPDGWLEYSDRSTHPHAKPLVLQQTIIRATTKRGGLVVDPAAGSYSAMQAARVCGREFLGCDLVEPEGDT